MMNVFRRREKILAANEDKTKEEIKEPTPEEKVKELEDKVARTLAEMENKSWIELDTLLKEL